MTPLPRGWNEVQQVANLAVHNINLPRNAAKGSWQGMSRRRLTWLFLVEVWELLEALWDLQWLEREARHRKIWCYTHDLAVARQRVRDEIGDCVAFLAFLGDRI